MQKRKQYHFKEYLWLLKQIKDIHFEQVSVRSACKENEIRYSTYHQWLKEEYTMALKQW